VAITGAHYLLYSNDPDADRAFFRDVLNFRYVDLGHNWLIFALPPAEMAVHPGDFAQRHADLQVLGSVLYLMCDDLPTFVQFLAGKKVSCTEIEEAEWGMKTTIRLPSGGEIGLYQPTHHTAI
jgi:catechol 2,3-dioxygenase-like lactoylglutathione lyase family enzyme